MPTRTALYGKNASKGGLFTIEDMGLSTGNRFFVDSGATTTGGDTAGHGTSPDAPFLTLDYALSSDVCTASNGDIIYVMPGHAEAIISAADIACDLAGVKIIGLGEGSDKPTFTFTTCSTCGSSGR